MSQREIQDLLRRIVLPPETGATMPTGKNQARIGPAVGVYDFNSGEADSEDGEEEEDDNNGSGGGGSGGSSGRGGDPRKDPTETPEVGEEIPGLTGLHDCQSGRCVNVNFTIPAMPPEGWSDACTPPETKLDPSVWKGKVYFKVTAIRVFYERPDTSKPRVETSREEKRVNLANIGAVAELFASFFEAGYGQADSYGVRAQDVYEYHLGRLQSGKLSGFSNSNVGQAGVYPTKSETWTFVASQTFHTEESWREINNIPKTNNWPPETCAEIESTKGGFKPACEDKDPNLPPALKGEYSGFELCDKNGNPVQIERHGRGWIYRTTEYEVEINETGTVMRVRPIA